ncbi:MAG TPA: hypothetical protein VIC08_04990 [Cellvibrionaceae bacterium]
MHIIKNSVGKLAVASTLMLAMSGTALAANGTHDGNICTLDNGDFCYSSDELYPVGTNLCDTWESDGSCSMNGVSGGHGNGLPAAKKFRKLDPAATPGTPPVENGSARQQR